MRGRDERPAAVRTLGGDEPIERREQVGLGTRDGGTRDARAARQCRGSNEGAAIYVLRDQSNRGFRFSTNAAIASRPGGVSAIIAMTSDAYAYACA